MFLRNGKVFASWKIGIIKVIEIRNKRKIRKEKKNKRKNMLYGTNSSNRNRNLRSIPNAEGNQPSTQNSQRNREFHRSFDNKRVYLFLKTKPVDSPVARVTS